MYRFYCLALAALLLATQLHAQSNSALISKGTELYNRASYDSSLVIFEKCERTALQTNDKKQLLTIYNHIGHIYSQTGKRVEAMKYYEKLAVLAEETGNRSAEARALINMGALYEEQKNYNSALNIYSKAEEMAITIKDSSIIADCANNRGVVYEQYLQKYPEALKEYNTALAIYIKMNDRRRMAMSYNNTGIVYKFLGNYPMAIELYKKSLQIAEELGDQFFIAVNMTNIGNVYAKMKDYNKAIDYNMKGLNIALKLNAMNVVVEAASSISDDYAGLKDYKKAFEWHQKYSAYSESLYNTEQTRQTTELESKYQSAKKEKEIILLKQQQEIDKLTASKQKLLLQKRKYQFIGVGIVVALLGIVAFLLYNRKLLKQRQLHEKAMLAAEYKERKRISSEMHDDIGAGLTQITLISEHALRKQPTGNNEFAEIAETSHKLISNMSEIVWSLNPENKTLDLLFAYLREQLNKLLEYSGIIFTIDFPETTSVVILSNEQRRALLLITKEIVHNAVKYSKAKRIDIKAVLVGQQLTFTVKDDGIGFDTTQHFSGNGMKNIKHRIQEVNGTLTIDSAINEGSSFTYAITI
ncbi:tetratricopeptide repeat protein [Ferruginibacter lapsinanis]|uniref:tetratricopeptide repeat-containing sensor histidine kinase n=1 Tax=Ferruginibacter lapsinanis TaxID=563172 RepID=UPI001E341B11|nr:tetratricopeptide repeat-containing sensor histidine kinase [Ferruginibacter lapsinanis]UEG49192.1 tetratricopeptide repeat protein [Ferruginibacter lapsinanis]